MREKSFENEITVAGSIARERHEAGDRSTHSDADRLPEATRRAPEYRTHDFLPTAHGPNGAETNGGVGEPSLSQPLIALMKGVLYREEQPVLWQSLLQLQPRIHDYVVVLGLNLYVDEGEGYAFLRQRQFEDEEEALPRLVHRRPLGFAVSLLLALLRKKLVEHDAGGSDPRLIMTKEQIVDTVRIFMADTGDEVRLLGRIETEINRVVDLGFLRKLKGNDDRYEVRRILASFVDAQWLNEFNERLAEYGEYLDREGD